MVSKKVHQDGKNVQMKLQVCKLTKLISTLIKINFSRIPIVIGAMYVRKYFHVDAKTNALEMVKYIKEQFKDILRSIDWMDNETRKSALEKANTIVDHIAYPDELLDDSKIIQLYQEVAALSKKIFLIF